MRVFLTNADKTELIAPGGGVTAGLGYVVGAIFVVAESTVAATLPFVGLRNGEVRLPKNVTEALTEGQIAYWDNAAKAIRNASLAGRFIVGSVRKAQASTDTTADVLLNGIHVVVI
jgi:predicted RecA/RadA family phage recombinase